MPTVTLTMSQWNGWLAALGKDFVPAAKRGAVLAAARSVREMVSATDTAPPASPNGKPGAHNTGHYKRSWKSRAEEFGARVFNIAPYSGVIEHGRRKGKFPPTEPIARWAQRRMGLTRKEAQGAAFVIARAIARRGLKPRKVMTNLLPKVQRFLNEEVRAELSKALTGKR